MKDFPKLKSPFVRESINGKYQVTPKIEEGYEWVFEDPEVLCTEKFDGTNVSIGMVGMELVRVYNRTNEIPLNVLTDNKFLHGIRIANGKRRIPMEDGQYFGELMGPKIQKNFLDLKEPEWFPFDHMRKQYSYRSYHTYPKTFENISRWFREDLFSLKYMKLHREKKAPEGVVFYQPSTGYMAKLRRDMFEWYGA